MKKELLMLFVLFLVYVNYAFDAVITTYPNKDTVEIGQMVMFDGSSSFNDDSYKKAIFNWDFGDGTAFKMDYPWEKAWHAGMNCVHYFMKPGTFKVMLAVTDETKTIDTTFHVVTVIGEKPLEGFEIYHAPFHARISQYLYVQIPENNASNQLIVKVTGINQSSGFELELLKKSNLSKEERVLLVNSDLPKGEYVITAELKNSANQRVSIVKEWLSKPYTGIPKVGINKDNAICINGKPFFPVTPWMLNKELVKSWVDSNYINCLFTEGWYETHTTNTLQDYLDVAKANNVYVIGPGGRWEGQSPGYYERNTKVQNLLPYLESCRDHLALLGWMWKDEPNLGGRDQVVPAPAMSAWTEFCHANDPHHPVITNLYGYDYLSYYGDTPQTYFDYLYSEERFGGKKHFAFDVCGFDIYPIDEAVHASLNGRYVFSEYLDAFDQMNKNNYKLIPMMAFVEIQDVEEKETPPPTYEQVFLMAWMNVIHGAKGINWFHYFGERPEENLRAMTDFGNDIDKYGKIILSAEPEFRKVATNANVTGNRVDAMLRYQTNGTDTTFYIFAARITEPHENAVFTAVNEPNSINVTFTVNGLKNQTVYSDNGDEIQLTNNSFSDTFKKYEVKKYRLGKSLSSVNKNVIKKKKNVIFLPQLNRHISVNFPNNALNIYNLKGQKVTKINIDQNRGFIERPISKGAYIISGNNQNT